MLRKLFLLCTLFSLATITYAQETPPLVRDAALDAGEAARGIRANNWRFEVLDPTTDSALGCPLVQGETMPVEVTPYRMSLLYPDGIYVVHVSADGQMVQLCDDKFGDAMTDPPVDDAAACTLTAQAVNPVYAAPDTRVAGIFSTVAGTAYEPFSRSADSAWYQITNDDNALGWSEATNFAVAGDCSSISVAAYTLPTEPTACYVTPVAAFSNIRNQPTTDSAQVAQIFENSIFQVSAQTTASDWFFIQPGWVAASVVQTIGACDAVTVNTDLVGVGFAEDTAAGTQDATVALALSQYACPANFESYLEPRIRVGFGTAAVQTGGVPNTLRNFPDVDDSIGAPIGTIQPGRTLDRVINGPVCNQGFVWWQVEIDGETGWTAESNAASGDYFLEARDDTTPETTTISAPVVAEQAAPPPPTQAPTPIPQAVAQAQPQQPAVVANVEGAAFTVQQGNQAIVDLALNTPQNTALYVASDTPTQADGVSGIVQIWDLTSLSIATRFNVTDDALYVRQAESGSRSIAVAGGNGIVSIVDPNTLALLQLISTGANAAANDAQFALSADGNALVVSNCADPSCVTSLITLYTPINGAPVWATQQPNHRVTAITISGDTVITAGNDGVNFWSLVDGSLLRSYANPTDQPISDVAVSVDGSLGLLVGCEVGGADACSQGRIALLDANGASLIGVVTAHSSAIQEVMYSPSGAVFATSDGNEIIVRNSSDGVERARYTVPGTTITTFTIYTAASGEILVSGTSDGRVVGWLLG